MEVHAVQACDEGERHEDRGYHGQEFHHFVHPVVDRCKIGFLHTGHDVTEHLNRVDDENDVIVDIAVIGIDTVADDLNVVPRHTPDSLTQGPDRFAKDNQFPLEGVDRFEGILAVVLKQGCFQLVDGVFDLFQNRQVVVDDRIDKRIGEVVRPKFPDLGSGVVYPLPDITEHVPRFFLKGHNEVLADDDAQLFTGYAGLGPAVFEHLKHDVEVSVEILDLRALTGVQNILKRQGFDPEKLPSLLDERCIVQSADIDPDNPVFLLEREAFTHVGALSGNNFGFVEGDHRNERTLYLIPAYMDQRAGWLAYGFDTAF